MTERAEDQRAGAPDAWLTASELAALDLPGLPDSPKAITAIAAREAWAARRSVDGAPLARPRQGRGGGAEYHYSLLPSAAQAELMRRGLTEPPAPPSAPDAAGDAASSGLWAAFERLPEAARDTARSRLDALLAVDAVARGGVGREMAISAVARQRGIAPRTLWRWSDRVAGVARADWLPVLAPRHRGRAGAGAYCDPAAWDTLLADYLRLERPSFTACYRRLQQIAAGKGWRIPSQPTLRRRVARELPEEVIVLAREGEQALLRRYPAQQRDRSVFHALEAVNADGHVFDVFVRWPDGTVGRPKMVAWQDLYSGMVLSWRVDLSENREAVRLSFGDMVEDWGIPDHAWLDNGRAFASKWLTGGTATRYRFKIRDEDPAGIMRMLGVEVHWTTPYHGQSKPIERAFRDFCDAIAKHPAFAGAYTGNTPLAKPENYGSRAVDLERFLEVVAAGVREHNTRTGRRSATAAGRSLQQTFEESYARAPIRRATEEQRRLWLLAGEGIRASKTDGALRLMGNRYWAEFLARECGRLLTVRFDPEALGDGIHVYAQSGAYLGHAPCIEATGFNDVEAARAHAAERRRWLRAHKEMLAAERRMDVADVARLLDDSGPADSAPARAKVVRPVFAPARPQGATAASAHDEDAFFTSFTKGLAVISREPSDE